MVITLKMSCFYRMNRPVYFLLPLTFVPSKTQKEIFYLVYLLIISLIILFASVSIITHVMKHILRRLLTSHKWLIYSRNLALSNRFLTGKKTVCPWQLKIVQPHIWWWWLSSKTHQLQYLKFWLSSSSCMISQTWNTTMFKFKDINHNSTNSNFVVPPTLPRHCLFYSIII